MQGNKSLFFFVVLALMTAGLAGCHEVDAKPAAETADVAAPQRVPFTEPKPLVLPANTAVYVRLQEPLSSSTAQEG
jgi:hypothetical protein